MVVEEAMVNFTVVGSNLQEYLKNLSKDLDISEMPTSSLFKDE